MAFGTVKVDSITTSTQTVSVDDLTTNAAVLAQSTANFTGTLQNGGSNVVVDSDIGSNVQAYNAKEPVLGWRSVVTWQHMTQTYRRATPSLLMEM